MNRYSSPFLVLALCTAILLACNKSNKMGDNGGVAGVTPYFGAGGAPIGAGGVMGTTSPNSSGGSSPMAPQVACNGALCGDPTSSLPPQIVPLIPMKPTACCDAMSARCGAMTSTGTCVATPPPDPRCPPIMVGGVSAPTCCSGTKKCGFYIAGLSCTVFDIPSLPPAPCDSSASGGGGTMAPGSSGMGAAGSSGAMATGTGGTTGTSGTTGAGGTAGRGGTTGAGGTAGRGGMTGAGGTTGTGGA
jgi:hypothetical protein